MRMSEIIILGIIILSFAIGIYILSSNTGKIASHWNTKGKVDKICDSFYFQSIS